MSDAHVSADPDEIAVGALVEYAFVKCETFSLILLDIVGISG